MGRLSTRVKQVVAKEIGKKPTKKEYKDVNVVRSWTEKGFVSVFYQDELIGKIKLLK